MLSRDEPLIANIWRQAPTRVAEPAVVAGRDVRVVSRDPQTGASSLLVQLPADWTGEFGDNGAVELFVLTGAVEIDDRAMSTAEYVYVPPGTTATCRCDHGASVLMFWTPAPKILVEELFATSLWSLPWEPTSIPGFPAGPMHKSLRPQDASGIAHGSPDGFLRVVLVTPGWFSGAHERHVDCWEENIMLQGDMLMPGRGVIAPGDTLANPRGHWHGPMTTKTGALFLVNCDAPMPVEYRDDPQDADELQRYLDVTPWAGAEPSV